MGAMMKSLCAALLLSGLLATSGFALAQTQAPSSPPRSSGVPPEIYRTTVRPLCSALRTKIQPAIGMMLQNDDLIAKSPAQFKEYSQGQFAKSDAQRSLALVRLSNLVTPIADNAIAIEKLLDDPNVFPPNERTSDDKQKNELKRQLLISLAQQQASLDIINGFVETQNLADMQHEGFGFLNAIATSDSSKKTKSALDNISPTPDPQGRPSAFDDTLINAGLPTNPYELDITKIPGLTLGYNPLSKIKEGVEFTQSESKRTEGTLAKTVMDTVRLCGGPQSSVVPSPSPNP
jgi:hypothetical protein